MTFAKISENWLQHYLVTGGHDGQGGRAGQGYRSILNAHLLPAFGDRPIEQITKQEYRAYINALKSRVTRRKKRVSARTVRNVHRLAQRIFTSAVEDDLLTASPCELARGDLPKERDSDPAWRAGSRFTSKELVALFTDERIPYLHRLTFCLLFFFAGRTGEVSALRWCSWDPEWEGALGRLTISHAYSTTDDVMRPNKTGIAREMPVHQFLSAMLRKWYLVGWPVLASEPKPDPADLVVPGLIDVDGSLVPLRNDRAQDWLRAACAAIGLRPRNPSAFRPSLITLAQAARVPSELVKSLTHPNSKEVFSGYSRFSWDEKSAAIRSLLPELAEGER